MQDQVAVPSRSLRHPLPLLVGFWACVIISIAVVVRRLFALFRPSPGAMTPTGKMDAVFSSHASLTVAHIVPAAVFVLLAVGMLFHFIEAKWLQRLFFIFGVITGVTAYAMSSYAIGGWMGRSAVLVFDTWFLFSLSCAYWSFSRGESEKQREWSSRAVGVLLGIATTRPVMGVFFGTSARTHLSPNQFFGIAFWIGFSVNAIITEVWLRSKWRAQLHQSRLAAGELHSSAERST